MEDYSESEAINKNQNEGFTRKKKQIYESRIPKEHSQMKKTQIIISLTLIGLFLCAIFNVYSYYQSNNSREEIKGDYEKLENQLEQSKKNQEMLLESLRKKEIENFNELSQQSIDLSSKIEKNKESTYQMINNKITKEIEQLQNKLNAISSKLNHQIFPKILWLYTQFDFESEKMFEQLLGNFIIQKAKESNFEIRFANSWSAYKWLSPETQQKITKTMQNNRFDQKVDDVLKMALLMEHGGLLIKLEESFFIAQNLLWMESYLKFDYYSKSTSQVLLFGQTSTEQQQITYQDFFIAAVKQSTLIRDTFNYLTNIIITGNINLQKVKKSVYINQEFNSTVIKDITKNIIHQLLKLKSPQFYKTSAIINDVSKFSQKECRDQLISLLKKSKQEYNSICGQSKYIVHLALTDRPNFEEELDAEIDIEVLDAKQHGYWHNWMTIPENRKLFQPSPPRKISFCIFDAHPSTDFSTLKESFQNLKNQNFKQWTAIYFLKQNSQQAKKYKQQQIKQGFNILYVSHTGSVGRNYEIGIIKHCPSKSFVLILRQHERILDNQGLKLLSQDLLPRPILGAFVGVNVSGNVVYSDSNYQGYNKYQFNGKNPLYEILNEIHNHFRVFHSDCYKIIPQFDLRTPEGQYFEDRFVFLEQFFYLVRNLTYRHDGEPQSQHTQKVKWYIKKNQDIFDVPNRIILNRNLVISTNIRDEVIKRDIQRLHHKIDSFPMTWNLDHLVQNGIPMQEFAVFNPANEFQSYLIRNKPAIIPKKIHWIWIGDKIPEVKLAVINMNKELYPDYQFKIWRYQDITREKFPLSYDLLQTIYHLDEISRFSKRASMADILRHEIVYNEGGFYMDTSMFLFNNIFNKWLSYKLVLAAQHTFRHRWSQAMCIFGAMPKFKGLLRIISHNNTNRYNLWKRNALDIAGPNNFRWLIRGMEQYDPDILIMNLETFYPMNFDLPNYGGSHCTLTADLLAPDDQVFFKWNNYNLIKNCGKYYPYAFGKEANQIGSSWLTPKW